VNRHDETFACMGTEVRVMVEDPVRDPSAAGKWARRYLEEAAARLTRFDPDSELSLLNGADGVIHRASQLLRTAVAAALWAAEATGGLVDPTVLPELRRAGYSESRAGATPAPLSGAVADAPPRSPARPEETGRWKAVHVTGDSVTRPPGIELDTSGTTKGLLADAVAHRLSDHAGFFVDCGGDIRVGGAAAEQRSILVEHPFTGEVAGRLNMTEGGVATSGLNRRLWRSADGTLAHHLIDPSTGRPAWTGLVSVTATAPTALEAETLAKSALLSGPVAAREGLRRHGGVLVLDDGAVEPIAPDPPNHP
jgi:thiamine biosynthesis lipoprotein